MMAASKPTSQLSMPSHIVYHLTDHLGPQLAVWVVSLSTPDVSTRCLSPVYYFLVFGVCHGLVSCNNPLAITVLYPKKYLTTRHYLNSFRGEPAISGFVQPFTPIHSSSANFATLVGSDLQCMLLHLHPGHGQLTRFRVYTLQLSPYSDSVSLRLPYSVKLATECKSLTHYTKGTQSRIQSAPTVCMHAVSGSISLPSRGSFRLSLTVLVHYRSITSIQPWRMVPPCSDRIPRVPPYFFVAQFLMSEFVYGTITLYGQASQLVLLSRHYNTTWLLRFRSPLLSESRLISFPTGTQMFQFSAFALITE